jgi:hypothetical protein
VSKSDRSGSLLAALFDKTEGGTVQSEPQPQHQWLQKLVGDWTYEGEALMGPGQPPIKSEGTESVRSLGGYTEITSAAATERQFRFALKLMF